LYDDLDNYLEINYNINNNLIGGLNMDSMPVAKIMFRLRGREIEGILCHADKRLFRIPAMGEAYNFWQEHQSEFDIPDGYENPKLMSLDLCSVELSGIEARFASGKLTKILRLPEGERRIPMITTYPSGYPLEACVKKTLSGIDPHNSIRRVRVKRVEAGTPFTVEIDHSCHTDGEWTDFIYAGPAPLLERVRTDRRYKEKKGTCTVAISKGSILFQLIPKNVKGREYSMAYLCE
jgi:hypothetical protein